MGEKTENLEPIFDIEIKNETQITLIRNNAYQSCPHAPLTMIPNGKQMQVLPRPCGNHCPAFRVGNNKKTVTLLCFKEDIVCNINEIKEDKPIIEKPKSKIIQMHP